MFEDFRLKVFMTLAEKGSFTMAAKALGVSQPAVSQNIAELEKSTGAELFTRTRGSVTLTPAGNVFMEYARRILYWYSSAEKMFGLEGQLTNKRRIRIVSDRIIADYILPGILSKLLAFSDSVSFDINGADSAEEADLVISGKPHAIELRLDEGKDFAVEIPAVAVSSNPSYSDFRSFHDLPCSVRLAVPEAYSRILGPDTIAMTAVISASAGPIVSLAAQNPDIVAIVPLPAAPSNLHRLNIPLPRLATDFYLRPSESFATSPVFSAIKRLFAEMA